MGILNRRVEYFEELLNNQSIEELEVRLAKHDGRLLPSPSMGRTIRTINRFYNHKSTKVDGVAVELVKYEGD